MKIRKYQPADCKEITQLFYDTVHSVNTKDYSQEQVDAWATGTVNIEKWNESFLENYSVVAVENGMITGFGDIDHTGYLDHLFVHKDYQGKGIATVICDALEDHVFESGIRIVYTHASITAKPFFVKRGYKVKKEQQVERRGVKLTNFVMEKPS
jgi:putative acetyltransferase